ncbi:MAG TPA: hypothetical protein VGY56_07690 [Verrucomicrobiae bacterium]|nr:hypothetical protein [Verrucomicrobiae bacterium]
MKRYKLWIEPPKYPVDPKIAKLLKDVILELAIFEDVTGPSCYEVERDEYVAQCATRFRDTIVEVLQKEAIAVSDEELDRICKGVAGEVFVIRALAEVRLNGEILVEDIKQVKLYQTYRGYFEASPEVEAKARQVAQLYADRLHKKAKDN